MTTASRARPSIVANAWRLNSAHPRSAGRKPRLAPRSFISRPFTHANAPSDCLHLPLRRLWSLATRHIAFAGLASQALDPRPTITNITRAQTTFRYALHLSPYKPRQQASAQTRPPHPMDYRAPHNTYPYGPTFTAPVPGAYPIAETYPPQPYPAQNRGGYAPPVMIAAPLSSSPDNTYLAPWSPAPPRSPARPPRTFLQWKTQAKEATADMKRNGFPSPVSWVLFLH